MSAEGSAPKITVSEEKLLLHLANFKLELFKELTATYSTVAQFEKLVGEIKEWRDDVDKRLNTVERFQSDDVAVSKKMQRLVNISVAIASAVIGAVLYTVLSGAHP